MTQNLWVVYRANPYYAGRNVDGITSVLINSDSSANAIANAALACNQYKEVLVTSQNSDYTSDMETLYTSNGFSDAFPSEYFDTAVNLGDTPPESGNFSANGDAYVFVGTGLSAPVFVAGSSYSPAS